MKASKKNEKSVMLLRIPKEAHFMLKKMAERQGVSLNTLCSLILQSHAFPKHP